jgi:hypothetical protein
MNGYEWLTQECEHCDGDHQSHRRDADGRWRSLGRDDRLRGFVCKKCDESLDDMLGERETPISKGRADR